MEQEDLQKLVEVWLQEEEAVERFQSEVVVEEEEELKRLEEVEEEALGHLHCSGL